MANEWIQSDGAACYDSVTPGYALSKDGVLTVGSLCFIQFTISNMTQGKLVLDSISSKPEYTEDGDYTAIGIVTSSNLTFIGEEHVGFVFDGCIDSVSSRLVPLITIKDTEGNTIFEQTDETGVTAFDSNIQYAIDWTDIAEGCYQVYFSALGIDYVSDCINLKLAHDCTILLSWTNDEDAYGFNYSDLAFTQNLRVKAKKWHPSYTKEKNVFKDNAGNRYILKSETSKEEILTISEMPQYLHDALAIGLEHDDFYIDSVKYTNEETEYSPKWRNSSQLAPSEVVVIKDQLLKNNNC
jgi:hypothetical protein